MAAPIYTQADFPGKFGVAQGYGVPAELMDNVMDCNVLVDRIPFGFSNQPIEAPEMITKAEHAGNDGTFQEGYCPVDVEWENHKFTYTAKSFGRCSEPVTDAALAAKQHTYLATRQIITKDGVKNIANEADYLLYLVLRSARKVWECQMLLGNSTTNAFNFDGLDYIIRAPVAGRLDLNGVAVPEANSVVNPQNGALTIAALYDMVMQLQSNGVSLSDVWILGHPGLISEVCRVVSATYQNPGAERERFLGQMQVPIGGVSIPLVSTDCAVLSGSAAAGYTGTLWFVSTMYYGKPSLWYSGFDFSGVVKNADVFGQQGLTPSPWIVVDKSERQTYCTSQQFCIWQHGKLVSAAPHSLGKITGITFSYSAVRTVNP